MKNKLYATTPDGVLFPSFLLQDGVLYATLADINETSEDNTIEDRFAAYLQTVVRPHKKLVRLDFLQPDDSVAFSLDNNSERKKYRDSRAFIQEGTLSVTLQNGQRRQASVTLANIDGAFEFNVNKIWFGQRLRLLMGVELPDGSEFYLPQGVFYINDPTTVINPNERTITYDLVDKWAYLDGTLFGNLETSHQILAEDEDNVYEAITSVLRMSKFDFTETGDKTKQIDCTLPMLSQYYTDKEYTLPDGTEVSVLTVPYDISTDSDSSTLADIILELNTILAGLIGYDATGALRLEPSQESIDDSKKPILWAFTPENSMLCGLTETILRSAVYNDVIIVGEGLDEEEVWGRATNFDPASDTNVNLIGRRTYREARSEYFNAGQCVALAEWTLKQKTVLQKSVSIECPQMYHLSENALVTIKRTDKEGEPVERHLIESFTLPLGETGAMTISAISVNDFPKLSTSSAVGG